MGAASTRILSTHWRCSSVTVVREICRHCCVILQRVANKLTGLEVDSTSRVAFRCPHQIGQEAIRTSTLSDTAANVK
jgi:hypothetical protein